MRHGIRVYRPRYRSSQSPLNVFGLIAFFCLVWGLIAINWLFFAWEMLSSRTQALIVILVILAVGAIAILAWLVVRKSLLQSRKVEQRKRAIELSDIDNMDGWHFEHYVAAVLKHRGYEAMVTPGSGDLGVDIVAQKDGLKYAIQVKRQSNPVSRKAVSDAVGGLSHYECDFAMVVTNNSFTPGAITLARSNNCQLIHREALADWIRDYQAGSPPTNEIHQAEESQKRILYKVLRWYGVFACILLGGHLLWFWAAPFFIDGTSQTEPSNKVLSDQSRPSPSPSPSPRKRLRHK